MGTLHYLVNYRTRKFFELGKGISYSDFKSATTKEELYDCILKRLTTGFFDDKIYKPDWAEKISNDIWDTVGLNNVIGYTDNDDDLFGMCGDCILVGTVYIKKTEVGCSFRKLNPVYYSIRRS